MKHGEESRSSRMQREVFNLIMQNPKMSLREAMDQVGYSKNTKTNVLVKTKNWQQLRQEYISDEDIAVAHDELLNAQRVTHHIFPQDEEDDVIKEVIMSIPGCRVLTIQPRKAGKVCYFTTPDNLAKAKAIDMGHKVAGTYAAKKIKIEDDALARASDEELMEMISGNKEILDRYNQFLDGNIDRNS